MHYVSVPSISQCGRIHLCKKGTIGDCHEQRNGHTIPNSTCGTARQSFVRAAWPPASAAGFRVSPRGTYQPAWLPKDIVAGLVLTAILVPVGMGYAEASGLPAIYGLYATIVPLIAYAIFGPSRILVLGPDSSLAAIIAATIVPLAAGDPDRLVALAGMLALMTGGLCILAGLAHFGFITDLLSKPIRVGYLNGIAFTVLVGQLPKILGFSSSGDNLIQETISLVQGVAQGLTNWVSVAIGVACLAIVLIFKRRWTRVPGVLIAVVGATIVVGAFDLAAVAGVSVVGPLPQGLPSFQIPRVAAGDLTALAAGAIAITLVSFADTSVLSRTFALRGGYTVDQNQELTRSARRTRPWGCFKASRSAAVLHAPRWRNRRAPRRN